MRSKVPVLPIVLAGVLALLIIVGFFYFRNQQNKADNSMQTTQNNLTNGASPSPAASVMAAVAALASSSPDPTSSGSPEPQASMSAGPGAGAPTGGGTSSAPADLSMDANGLSKATVVITTNQGVIKYKFYPKDAPNTVNRMVTLIQQGFYNGLLFHRVAPGFVIQGGDPLGTGTGGSGQKLKAEFNNRRHIEGTVAMARASDPDSADSQFYITLGTHPHLDHNYTVFGQVIEGMDVAKKIKVGDKMLTVKIDN